MPSSDDEKNDLDSEQAESLDRVATYRVIDANANRASEGLRVIEEYARFVLNDKHLTELTKALRHDLAGVVRCFSLYDLNVSRDTQADVGTDVSTASEYRRDTTRSILLANQKRVEQSLRCLEEYAKAIRAELAVQIEQIRYRAYTLARAFGVTRHSAERLRGAKLYVLVDGRESTADFERLVVELVSACVDVVQLRDKRMSDRELVQRGRLIQSLTSDSRTLFIMNDRPDLALLTGAAGVHIGQDELSVHDVRRILGVDRIVGVSTHNIQQARQAVLDGANYIGCGPTFPSSTKPFSDFAGINYLEQVAAEITLPAFAIGGITLENAPSVLATGVRRVAVSGAVVCADSPKHTVEELRRVLGQVQ